VRYEVRKPGGGAPLLVLVNVNASLSVSKPAGLSQPSNIWVEVNEPSRVVASHVHAEVPSIVAPSSHTTASNLDTTNFHVMPSR